MATYSFMVKNVTVTVSSEDAERVKQWSWWLTPGGYIKGHVNHRPILLHHFIIGKPEQGYVVDHMNNNKYDNRRENLRFATYAQNAQNRVKQADKTSRYRGVYAQRGKWYCEIGRHYGGVFVNEIDAARQADKLTYSIYGSEAKTNELLTDEEVVQALAYVLPQKEIRNLPRGVRYDKHVVKKPFYTCLRDLQGKRVRKFHCTLEEALAHQQLTQQKVQTHSVLRNEQGISIIVTTCGQEVLIDEEDFEMLSTFRWAINKQGYVVNSQGQLMHRMLQQVDPGRVVDHINCNKQDNRRGNLRCANFSENSQNRRKKPGCSSRFTGVYSTEGKWRAYIKLQYKTFSLGCFDKEEEAAAAYDEKAKELYSHPRLNFPSS